MENCSALTPYGVLPRYPDEVSLGEHLAQKAVHDALQIKLFVEGKLARTI